MVGSLKSSVRRDNKLLIITIDKSNLQLMQRITFTYCCTHPADYSKIQGQDKK